MAEPRNISAICAGSLPDIHRGKLLTFIPLYNGTLAKQNIPVYRHRDLNPGYQDDLPAEICTEYGNRTRVSWMRTMCPSH